MIRNVRVWILASLVALRPLPAQRWHLVWSDEFDGPAGARVDSTKWRYALGDGCAINLCGWGNAEREYYGDEPSNVSLNGKGQLVITARRAPLGLQCYYGPCGYVSGKITTQKRVDFQPGRVEARIKLPAGQGLWPAFWMLGANIDSVGWPASGELDIMENRGSKPGITSSAVHGPGYSGATPFAHEHTLGGRAFADDFHVFAVEWDSTAIRFFVDSVAHYTLKRAEAETRGKWVFDQPAFININLAVGGIFDGDPRSDTEFPAAMVVDYVRVYRASADLKRR